MRDPQLEQIASDYIWGAEAIARFLRMDLRQLYNHRDKLPIGKLGRTLYASERELQDYLDGQIRKGKEKQGDESS